ncbi:NUDIX domain-containing protein [Methyloversatilis sp.]|uniref:NUDIX domain-containing protein n=1 Tax=Methyloversatilis sp. TaxID=2569862 RepID=UPI0035ADFACA
MKTAFVIGRFQPFHNGHKKLIDYALTLADRVTVIIGDTGCARSFRDPWTQEERVHMIRAAYNNDERIKFAGVLDYPYSNVRWSHGVQAVMKTLCPSGDGFIVGMQKDDTSFYLDLFPGVEVVKMPVTEAWESEEDIPVSGTAIRRMIFNTESPNYHINMKWVKEVALPRGVQEALQCNAYRAIVEEFRAIKADEQLWMCPGTSMYGLQPKVAVDAMIHTPTRILLIERGGARGRGNFALPGGYLDQGERLYAGALRELREEAGIELRFDDHHFPLNLVPYDHPNRSSGIRTITNVLDVMVSEEFADANKPVPGDDAQSAFWCDKSALNRMRENFFSDHWHIIKIQLENRE